MNQFMQIAIEEAMTGYKNGQGGFFGAVIVKDGQIVGQGHNTVLADHDPTCHGEVVAIRDACRKLGTFDLTGCEIYTTSEPCPMCLGAIMWANVKHVYYGLTIHDAKIGGYRDEEFYRQLATSTDKLRDRISQIDYDECLYYYQKYAAGSPAAKY